MGNACHVGTLIIDSVDNLSGLVLEVAEANSKDCWFTIVWSNGKESQINSSTLDVLVLYERWFIYN